MLAVLGRKERSGLLEFLEVRFGIGDIFSNHEFYSGRKGRVFLGPRNIVAENFLTAGFEIARLGKKIKLSSSFAQLFGRHAAKNRLSLTKEKAVKYMNGYPLVLEGSEAENCENGLVMVFYKDLALGCALLHDNEAKNMLPKAKRAPIKFI